MKAGRYRDRNRRRTAGGRKKNWLLAVLFFLLLPYFASAAVSSGQEKTVREESGRAVLCSSRAGTWQVPLDTYLKGALAASIPIDCGKETMKAQAVILRTLCEYAYSNREKITDTVIPAAGIGQTYLDRNARKELWEEAFEDNEQKITEAVAETKGMVLTAEGRVIEPAYFWLSAGRTREGEEVFGEGNYSYFTGVDCDRDMEAEEFLQEKEIPLRQFLTTLQEAAGAQEKEAWEGRIVLSRDSSRYVTQVAVDGYIFSGEAFRTLFDLPSACFEIIEKKDSVLLRSKGVGHGLGFDQYAASRLEAEGKDYRELLNIFFAGVEIEKFE